MDAKDIRIGMAVVFQYDPIGVRQYGFVTHFDAFWNVFYVKFDRELEPVETEIRYLKPCLSAEFECDSCSDTGRVPWEPGACIYGEEDDQPCPDCGRVDM